MTGADRVESPFRASGQVSIHTVILFRHGAHSQPHTSTGRTIPRLPAVEAPISHVLLRPVEPSPGTATSSVPSTRHAILPSACTPHINPCNPALCKSSMQPRKPVDAAGWRGASRGRKTPHQPPGHSLPGNSDGKRMKNACERRDWLSKME